MNTEKNTEKNTAKLQLTDLTVHFGNLAAVDHVNLLVEPGEFLGIIGPNGAGKTTLFNLITGVVKPTEGDVIFDGSSVLGLRPDKVAMRGISRTFQNIRLFPMMTVRENLAISLHRVPHYNLFEAFLRTPKVRRTDDQVQEEATRYLQMMGLEEYADSRAGSLPYGVQRKLEIARAVASKPKLLLLDEPAAGMNNEECEELVSLLKEIHKNNDFSIILIEHHMKVVMQLCKRIMVLNLGAELMTGTPQQVQNDPDVIKAYLGNRRNRRE